MSFLVNRGQAAGWDFCVDLRMVERSNLLSLPIVICCWVMGVLRSYAFSRMTRSQRAGFATLVIRPAETVKT